MRKFTGHVNMQKDDGFTPLHLASVNDHLDVITALVDNVCTYVWDSHIIQWNIPIMDSCGHKTLSFILAWAGTSVLYRGCPL